MILVKERGYKETRVERRVRTLGVLAKRADLSDAEAVNRALAGSV